MEEIGEIQKKLEKVLKRKRYQHTVGVRYTAQAMAMKYGIDMKQAGYAGVLHDCAKNIPEEELLLLCKENQLGVSETEQRQPFLLHAKAGAFLAKNEYGITDEDILSAICWHTTGKPKMTLLEKIIFIADYIEPNRKNLPGMEKIRKAAFENLDMAMYLILKNTIAYITKNPEREGMELEEHTLLAYEYYKQVAQKLHLEMEDNYE